MTAHQLMAEHESGIITREERLQGLAKLAADGDSEARELLFRFRDEEQETFADSLLPTHVEEVMAEARLERINTIVRAELSRFEGMATLDDWVAIARIAECSAIYVYGEDILRCEGEWSPHVHHEVTERMNAEQSQQVLGV